MNDLYPLVAAAFASNLARSIPAIVVMKLHPPHPSDIPLRSPMVYGGASPNRRL
jgi:hypothetical protein